MPIKNEAGNFLTKESSDLIIYTTKLSKKVKLIKLRIVETKVQAET